MTEENSTITYAKSSQLFTFIQAFILFGKDFINNNNLKLIEEK